MKRFKYLFDFFAFPNNLTINCHKTDKFFDFSIVESLLKKEDKNITPVKTTPNKLESRYHSNSLLRKQWSSQDTNIIQKNRMTPLKELAKSVNASPKQIYDKIRALKQKVRCA